MKLFIIGSLLFAGGSGVAMQNEEVNATVKEQYEQVEVRVQRARLKNNLLEQVKENGFPYPCEDFLSTLNDEEALQVVTEIDLINATYDWPNMTDDEIVDALQVAKLDLETLYDELGIEKASFSDYKEGNNEENISNRIENLKENGVSYPTEERTADLTEEQITAIYDKIDSFNETYDFTVMTDDEILEAITVMREEMQVLLDDLGIELPQRENYKQQVKDQIQERIQNRFQNRNNNNSDSNQSETM